MLENINVRPVYHRPTEDQPMETPETENVNRIFDSSRLLITDELNQDCL